MVGSASNRNSRHEHFMIAPIAGDPDLERLRELVDSARRAVVFTGAGISTESGIPDFRSPGGMWSRRRPVDFRDFVASAPARREAWSQRIESHRTMARAEPNHGHRAVASLVHRGIVTTVITQNIDGLHQRSGVPDAQVVELHGNSTYARPVHRVRGSLPARTHPRSVRARRHAAGVRTVRRAREDRHHLVRPGHAGGGNAPRGGRDRGMRPVSRVFGSVRPLSSILRQGSRSTPSASARPS